MFFRISNAVLLIKTMSSMIFQSKKRLKLFKLIQRFLTFVSTKERTKYIAEEGIFYYLKFIGPKKKHLLFQLKSFYVITLFCLKNRGMCYV